jgi:hypothetical protein
MKVYRRVFQLLSWLVALPGAVVLLGAALSARPATGKRRRRGEKPRLLYGPRPIISIKYMSRAMQCAGYEAQTFVDGVYHINQRSDYDYYIGDFFTIPFLKGNLKRVFEKFFGPYLLFLWALSRFDLFHFFFDGGFLAETPLRFWEVQLLHLAGKKVIVMPYGSDVAVPSQIHSMLFRQGLMMNYPRLGTQEARTVRQIRYFTRHADFIVGCLFHAETLPRWDLLPTHYYPIDTESWTPTGHYSAADGRNGAVTIVHTPNHRGLKGTEFLVAACEALQAEGLQVKLCLLERVPNQVVKERLREADILAEQFVVGYALSAMEGMALGKPVMSNLSDDHYYQIHRLYTGLDECPIVSTAIDEIKENLRQLITDPQLRRTLGEAGRGYVLKYHSYTAVAAMWDLVYRKIWFGEAIDLTLWHPDRIPAVGKQRP